MKTAHGNVTEISRYSRERRNAPGRSPLDECREMAVLGLKQALGDGLEEVKQQLLRLADKTAGADLYHLYMDGLELVRDHREGIENAFRSHFLQGFNQACRRDSKSGGKNAAAAELSLLEPDDLEETLAADTLANAIHNGCAEELFGLDRRIGLLVNDPEMVHGDNPLGPEVFAEALNAALEAEQAGMKARLLLIAQLSKVLPDRIREVYRDINQRLVQKNVLPVIRAGLRRQGAPSPSPQSAQSSFDQPGFAVPGNSGDVFGMLRQLMGGGAGVMPLAGPALPGETGAVGVGDAGGVVGGGFIHALGQLQRGQGDFVVRAGIDPAALSNGRINILHGLRKGGMANDMPAMDAMTLDIVAMVFDYILGDGRIPDAMKALIGRLQIPVLKVAMLDKAFFSHKSQPARRLLDTLADAAIGWDAGEGHESGLYKTVAELVERILDRFDDKIEIFSEALAELEQYLAGERREAAEAAAASVQVVMQQEIAERSQRTAHDEVESCLIGQPVPAVIVQFLAEHWQRVLADACRASGEEGEDWKQAVQTMTDLVWSIVPKYDAGERRKLVSLLPGLLRRLDAGITRLGLSQNERDGFFAELVKCHAEAVRAGMQDEPAPADVFEIPGMDSDIPILTDKVEFEAVEPVTGPVEPADEIIEELVAEPVPAAVALAAGPDSSGIESLERGSWIAYREEDGSEVRARLSWVSPMRGIYLFTNRHGQRAISISADGLQAKLEDGSVRILSDAPLMDRAVDDLMTRLQRNVA